MAADNDVLQRRIAALETQLAALSRIIAATPSGALAINAPGGLSITSGGAMAITAGTVLAMSAGSNITATAGGRIRLNGSQEITLDSRQCHLSATVEMTLYSDKSLSIEALKDAAIDIGKNLAIAAADSATVKTGGASLTMKKDGTVNLHGRDVSIQASGRIDAKAASDITMKGSKIRQN